MRLDEHLKVKYEATVPMITASEHEWKKYLSFAAGIYKHSFDNALLVYAQKPEYTTIATLKTWNKFGRRVNAGEKGAPVCGYYNAALSTAYLFDITQTNGGKTPEVWRLDSGLKQELDGRYSRELSGHIAEKVKTAASEAVEKYIRNFEAAANTGFGNIEKLPDIIEKSALYLVSSRCGLATDIDLSDVVKYNTAPEMARIGYVITELSKDILLEIERDVKAITRERRERKVHYERTAETNNRENLARTGNTLRSGRGEPSVKQGY